MILEFLTNGAIRGLLALIVVLFVCIIYTISVIQNNDKLTSKMTQTMITIISIVITFYFATELNKD